MSKTISLPSDVPVNRQADALADAVQELSEAVAALRRYLKEGRLDMALWISADIQHTCLGLGFRYDAVDMLCSLGRMIYDILRGRIALKPPLVAAIGPLLDAMEAEVALLEEP